MTTAPKIENKERIAVWLKPSEIQRMDSWLEADNCKNRSEFVGRALRFYMGYLSTEDTSEFLSAALVDVLQGTMDYHTNRFRSLIFKWCVELNIALHTIAAHFDVDESDRLELRRFAVDEVKRTNGQISFDRALHIQRQKFDEE